MFPDVKRIVLRKTHFKQIRLNRNNRFYGFILKVCELIFENLLPSEEAGKYLFSDFRRDEGKMRTLFEKFLLNFYRLEQKEYRAKGEQLTWQMETLDEDSATYLPTLNTDISLIGKERKIIIDAKFYKDTLSVGRYGNQRVRSAHLYQIFAYLMHQENPMDKKTLSAKGILLYPEVGKSCDLNYRYREHDIQVKTVNLMVEWREIRRQLLAIIR